MREQSSVVCENTGSILSASLDWSVTSQRLFHVLSWDPVRKQGYSLILVFWALQQREYGPPSISRNCWAPYKTQEPWKQEFVGCPLLLIMGVILVAYRGNVKSMKAQSTGTQASGAPLERGWLCPDWCQSGHEALLVYRNRLLFPPALRTSAV